VHGPVPTLFLSTPQREAAIIHTFADAVLTVFRAFVIASRCIGEQVGTKRRAPVVAAYVPYAFVEAPHGVRVPKYTPQQQQQQQQQQQEQQRQQVRLVGSDGSDDEFDEHAPVSALAREDWLVVLAKAAPHKKEWVRRPGK
jgi:hypothetical protein